MYGGLILVIIHGMLKGGWGSAEKRLHSTCSAEVSLNFLGASGGELRSSVGKRSKIREIIKAKQATQAFRKLTCETGSNKIRNYNLRDAVRLWLLTEQSSQLGADSVVSH